MKLIYWGAVNAASDITTAAAVNTGGTQTRSAVVALIQAVTPGIIAQDPTVAAAAAAAVTTALQDASIVKAGLATISVPLGWGYQDVVVPANVPANVPATSTVQASKRVPVLGEDGRIDAALLPVSEDGGDLTQELATVADRGRPLYAPLRGTYDATRSLFNFRPGQMLPWMVAREKARRGTGRATALVLGTSISRIVGDIQAGETYPVDAWPGQSLGRLGLPVGGTGIRHLSTDIPLTSHVGGFAEPTITVANPGTSTNKVEALALGFAQSSFAKITDSGTKTAYVEFNTNAGSYTDLWLYGQEIAGTSVVTIDGVDRTWAGSTAVSGADIPALAGFASGQRISRITVPAGTHTVRVHGTAAGVPFGGFEGRNASGVILHRGAIAGRSQLAFFNTTGNLDGLAWAIDPWAADLVLDELHVNDWQNHYSVPAFKAQKLELWQRAKSKGAAVLSVIAPTPDLNLYPVSGGNVPPVTDYIGAIYDAALEAGVPVLDLSHRWGSYPTAAAFYAAAADHIHPNALGASDIAASVAHALLA